VSGVGIMVHVPKETHHLCSFSRHAPKPPPFAPLKTAYSMVYPGPGPRCFKTRSSNNTKENWATKLAHVISTTKHAPIFISQQIVQTALAQVVTVLYRPLQNKEKDLGNDPICRRPHHQAALVPASCTGRSNDGRGWGPWCFGSGVVRLA
jgi:hypothetical protein